VPKLNAQGKLDVGFHGFEGCKVELTTVTASGLNVLDFTTAAVFDTNSLHDEAGANPSRITIKKTGYYSIIARMDMADSGAAWGIGVRKNGTAIGRAGNFTDSSTDGRRTSVDMTLIEYLEEDDYIEMQNYAFNNTVDPKYVLTVLMLA
jgi:hypothetical protein